MKGIFLSAFLLLTLCAAATGLWIALGAGTTPAVSSFHPQGQWNAGAAASYLESREVWWQKWPSAQMDHGTVCISCHTVVPYAMVQPMLRQQLGKKDMTAPEEAMLKSVERRVTQWTQMAPFYSDEGAGPGKTAESRATEAVLNAVILAHYDTVDGQLGPITRKAFDEAWALQERSGDDAGAWKWQDFRLAPWESKESAYQGAALFALALGSAPDRYLNDSDIQDNVNRLREYLRRKYSSQSIMSQLYVLWASGKMPGLLTASDRNTLIERIETLQQSDGGWALSSMQEPVGWKRIILARWNRLAQPSRSDGCATGLAVLALQVASANSHEVAIRRGLEWLNQHQEEDGSWWASSLNGLHDPDIDISRFMQDAATGYAVLALETARVPDSPSFAPKSMLGAEQSPPRTATY
jgi:squalene-hopene/tetraprenyl-beta-curcumene cyclase